MREKLSSKNEVETEIQIEEEDIVQQDKKRTVILGEVKTKEFRERKG